MDTPQQNELKCLNCGHPLEDHMEYCPSCGQRTKEKLSFSILFANTIGDFLALDSRFLKSLPVLLFRPGRLTKVFVSGQRKRYLHPGRMYLFSSFVFLLASTMWIKGQMNNANLDISKKIEISQDGGDTLSMTLGDILDSVSAQIKDEAGDTVTGVPPLDSPDGLLLDIDSNGAGAAQGSDFEDKVGVFNQSWIDKKKEKFTEDSGRGLVETSMAAMPYALFLMIPFFALLLKIFFWRKGRYAEHFVFVLHYMSFLFFTLFLLILALFIFHIHLPAYLNEIITAYLLLYLTIASVNFYKGFWLWTAFKSLFVFLIYLFMLVAVVLASLAGGFMML